jgi:hypothetical protein
MPSIYIAGPMTGYPRYNFDAFDQARNDLERDWEVISPADMDRELGFDPDKSEVTIEFLRDAMDRDIAAVMRADALYALAGWEKSKGASAEVALAKWRGIPIHFEVVEASTPALIGTDPKGAIGKTKSPMWLLPPRALLAIAWVHGLGANKYGPWNWRKTKVCASTYISAIQRHLAAWHERQDNDEESGQSHLAHIGACVNILLDAQYHNKLDDDRP